MKFAAERPLRLFPGRRSAQHNRSIRRPCRPRLAMQPLSVPELGFFSGGNDVELRSPHCGGWPFQREALADLLKSEGLEVVECANGEVAELVLATTGAELRALVTDIELGGKMSGVELAQYAKRQFPGLNVVMVSGHLRPARHPLSYEALLAAAPTGRCAEVS